MNMNDVITIEDMELAIREYNGQRVVTMKDIDMVHHKKSDTAKKSFQKHKNHFILGTDYFEITRKELGERYSPNEKIVGNPNMKTYLFTESGYLMIVKVFTDDLAWQIQRQLVNAYFNVKEQEKPMLEADPLEFSTHRTSSTPVPRNPSFYARNKRKINRLCNMSGATRSTVYHHILMRVGEEYNLEAAEKIYENERGHKPVYPMDMIDYFPELGRLAEDFLDGLIAFESRRNR